MIEGSCHCGAVRWSLAGDPGAVTACNCTQCRRYGGLWAYGFEGEAIRVAGPTSVYARADEPEPYLENHFCTACGCVAYWRGLKPQEDGRRRMAVNVRLAEPDAVGDLAVRRFDGLDSFADLPSDGRCVRDMWF